MGSLNFVQAPLTLYDGLAYLTLSWAQQLLILAGGFSVFVGDDFSKQSGSLDLQAG